MTKCPKCKEEIENLNFSKTKEISGSVVFDGNDIEFIEEFDIYEEQKPHTYRCPECNEILFENDEEAEEFLRDDDELQEIVKEKLKLIEDEN